MISERTLVALVEMEPCPNCSKPCLLEHLVSNEFGVCHCGCFYSDPRPGMFTFAEECCRERNFHDWMRRGPVIQFQLDDLTGDPAVDLPRMMQAIKEQTS